MTQPAVVSSHPDTHSPFTTTGAPQSRKPAPNPTHRRHPVHHDRPSVFTALQSLLHLIVIAIFIITFCVQPFRIPSESMESTLLVGDFLLVDKQAAAPDGAGTLLPAAAIHRGDIIVFHDPVDASLHLVKRVIGLPGDHLRLRDGRVYINGHALTEPYAVYRPSPPDNFRDNFPRLHSADPEIDSHWWIRMRSLIENNELIIPTGNYFVLGDNRNDSEDSRYWGFVPREAIVGKPLVIYFSLQTHEADDTDGTGASIAQSATATPTRRHPGKIDSVVDFARWGRTFQIVR
ncbi:signal peptidase I [Tunturibacter empetritectus]|uniref:Signal peptidase I n=1 Tax=Tunturiibacter lichenicola TaxID=2051959 RepID=A0A7W8N5A7_9BACT|nr:signal peptidase I [Edaphobacter lichenicola]MBB5343790.1 signal peptidase I [Edaphobacter lichenicola]